MRIGRRALLRAGGAAAVAAALPLPYVLARRKAPPASLVADPAGVLDLPPGFSYRVVGRSGKPMTDGYRMPGMPDGMACFDGPGGALILMRNHEVSRVVGQGAIRPDQAAPPEAYDPTAHGGVTRVVLDARTLEKRSDNLVLTGTLRNCAGGASPWGWLSCEETSEVGHGYVFLCRTDAAKLSPPRKIASYGRFVHEAVCIDPATAIAYLTEDRDDGCLYRFVPNQPSNPFEGKLQALKLAGRDGFDTATGMKAREKHAVSWVDVTTPDSPRDDLRMQARRAGAARIRRGEGISFAGGKVFICSTTGGAAGAGQIFELDPSPTAERFSLLAESPGHGVLDCPDNIFATPWGHVLMAEDGGGDQFVRGLTPDGRVYDVARNAGSSGEIAGVCLSPDGMTMFLNLQREGLTLAVRGPLRQLGPPA